MTKGKVLVLGSNATRIEVQGGGTVITAAGTDNRVAGLVYIAAFAPDNGETGRRTPRPRRGTGLRVRL
jgi:hypothetical protein